MSNSIHAAKPGNRPPIGVVILSLLIFLYGVVTTLFSVIGIQLFSSGFFNNFFGLTITILLIPLDIIWVATGVGILRLKEWGVGFLLMAGPMISLAYFLLIMQYVLTGQGLMINFLSLLLLLAPILLVYTASRLKIKMF